MDDTREKVIRLEAKIERLEDEVKRWRFVAELFAECDPNFRPMKAYFEEFSRET